MMVGYAFVARQSQYRGGDGMLGMAPIDIYGMSYVKGKGLMKIHWH
jgi:hypothetical protein